MDAQEQKSAGGIIIPDTAKEKPRMGTIKAVGTDEELKKIVKEGDKVLYGKYSGDEIEMDNKKYLIVKRDDILAVVK
jgi:chaperonin GroES